MPIVSVVIPAYNAIDTVLDALHSVLMQSFQDIEVIVVDDGSTDDSASFIKALSDSRTKLHRTENRGVSNARNTGASIATGRYLVFLDADDILAEDAFERHLSAFGACETVVATYGERTAFSSIKQLMAMQASVKRSYADPRPSGDVLSTMLQLNLVSTPGIAMIRMDAFKKTTGFPEDLIYAEDWVFWCDLAAIGHFVYVPDPSVAFYRVSPGSAVRTLALDTANIWPALDLIYSRRRVLDRFPRLHRWNLRRKAECAALVFCGQQMLSAKHWTNAQFTFLRALLRQPLRLRHWKLWARAAFRY